MATYARGLTSQAVNLTHTTHWSECLMYYVANACSNRNLCNWRVYTSAGDGKPEALNETPFPTEDELQALIAEHPQLLDGAQIRPGDARRWFLVTREKGIAASAGAAARWAVDHVIIDQDAVPTLAEVQCSSNPEIRRTIVGQLLEYAAYASETWTAEELRGAFKRHTEARGRLRKPSLRPCCKRMETPMWTGSGRTHPTPQRSPHVLCQVYNLAH